MSEQIPDTTTACCGKDSWTTARAPLVNSCKLCPSSPTYWRMGTHSSSTPIHTVDTLAEGVDRSNTP